MENSRKVRSYTTVHRSCTRTTQRHDWSSPSPSCNITIQCSLPYANTDVVISLSLDRNVFNTSQLRTKSRCQNISVNDLQYGDNKAVPCHSVNCLQQVSSCWVDTYSAFGLTVNKKKTKTLHLGSLLSPPQSTSV